ncbi:TM2 domain-containing protein [Cellulomonas sp. P5_C5]
MGSTPDDATVPPEPPPSEVVPSSPPVAPPVPLVPPPPKHSPRELEPATPPAPVIPLYVPAWMDPTAPYGRDRFTGEPLSDKSKAVAGLLQIFLGSVGAGRWYTGHTGIASAQLALLAVGIGTAWLLIGFLFIAAAGAWSFIDGIVLLAGNSRDARGLKLR